MAIAINSSNQFFSAPNSVSSGEASAASSKQNLSVTTAPITEQKLIQPAPLVRVADDGGLESPYIEITKNTAENTNRSYNPPPTPAPADNTRTELAELSQQASAVNREEQQLIRQQQAIQKEIANLHKQELEINRKRFQLKNQSIGNLVNLQA